MGPVNLQHNGKLDLGCGDSKRPGFTGVDKFKTDSTDLLFDLLVFPWPIASGSTDEIHCANFFEHVPAKLRTSFMEEVHRVMKAGSKAVFITPMFDRMFQDPTHEWPPIVPNSYLYWNQEWLKQNKLMHGSYVTSADFFMTFGYAVHPDFAKSEDEDGDDDEAEEKQRFALLHYNNAISDLFTTLIKK